MTDSVGNSFAQIAQKYKTSDVGNAEGVSPSANKAYFNQLTSNALDEVSADSPDYSVEGGEVDDLTKASTIMSGIQGILQQAGSCLQQVAQMGNNKSAGDGEDAASTAADGYNKVLDDFNKNPAKNLAKLESAITSATTDLTNVTNSIGDLNKKNALLEKAKNDEVAPLLQDLQENISTAQNEKSNAEETIENCKQDLTAIGNALKTIDSGLVQNGQAQVKVEGLSNQENGIKADAEGNIKIALSDEADTNAKLDQLAADYTKSETDYNDKAKAVTTAEGSVRNAQIALDNAKYTPIYKTEKDPSDPEKTIQVRDEKAEQKAVDKAQKAVDKAQKELDKAKEEKEKAYQKMLDIAKNIQVGETTLDKIIESRHNAEAKRDQAQANIDAYATELKGYINEEAVLNDNKFAQQANEGNVKNRKTANETLADALVSAGDDMSQMHIDTNEAEKTAAKELLENNDKLKAYEQDKTALTKFISDAKAAKNAKIKSEGDESAPAASTTKPGSSTAAQTLAGGTSPDVAAQIAASRSGQTGSTPVVTTAPKDEETSVMFGSDNDNKKPWLVSGAGATE